MVAHLNNVLDTIFEMPLSIMPKILVTDLDNDKNTQVSSSMRNKYNRLFLSPTNP